MSTSTSADGHVEASSALPKNECFGCGKDNPEGMHLEFIFEGNQAVCRMQLTKRYQGPPGHCHGGIIATILDEAMGKVNKLRNVVALTKSMEVDYLRPVPLNTDLTIVGWEQKVNGRVHINAAEIRDVNGEVLAHSNGVFIAIDPAQMFKDHLPLADS